MVRDLSTDFFQTARDHRRRSLAITEMWHVFCYYWGNFEEKPGNSAFIVLLLETLVSHTV